MISGFLKGCTTVGMAWSATGCATCYPHPQPLSPSMSTSNDTHTRKKPRGFAKYFRLALLCSSFLLLEMVLDLQPSSLSSPAAIVADSSGTGVGILREFSSRAFERRVSNEWVAELCTHGACSGFFQAGDGSTEFATSTLFMVTQLFFLVDALVLWLLLSEAYTTFCAPPLSTPLINPKSRPGFMRRASGWLSSMNHVLRWPAFMASLALVCLTLGYAASMVSGESSALTYGPVAQICKEKLVHLIGLSINLASSGLWSSLAIQGILLHPHIETWSPNLSSLKPSRLWKWVTGRSSTSARKDKRIMHERLNADWRAKKGKKPVEVV